MLKAKMLPLAMTLLLSACTTTIPDSFCDIARPIYISKSDKVSGDTARQILQHDDTGATLCGWERV